MLACRGHSPTTQTELTVCHRCTALVGPAFRQRHYTGTLCRHSSILPSFASSQNPLPHLSQYIPEGDISFLVSCSRQGRGISLSCHSFWSFHICIASGYLLSMGTEHDRFKYDDNCCHSQYMISREDQPSLLDSHKYNPLKKWLCCVSAKCWSLSAPLPSTVPRTVVVIFVVKCLCGIPAAVMAYPKPM